MWCEWTRMTPIWRFPKFAVPCHCPGASHACTYTCTCVCLGPAYFRALPASTAVGAFSSFPCLPYIPGKAAGRARGCGAAQRAACTAPVPQHALHSHVIMQLLLVQYQPGRGTPGTTGTLLLAAHHQPPCLLTLILHPAAPHMQRPAPTRARLACRTYSPSVWRA